MSKGISRRGFLGLSAAATAALGCGKPAVETKAPEMAPAKPAVPPFELDEVTLEDLRKGLASGQYTVSGITKMYLQRIEQVDRSGPKLNSVIEINPDAEAIAADLDRELKEKGPRGPLHGIPILIKDNIATADKMETTAGSLAMLGARPPEDSFLAARLRQAGMVILGKTNLSEWANFRSSETTSGWSGRGGLTLNPYALDRNPSGSSAGSGAAAAANLCAVAIGTETDGSIISPSSVCGLVGIKPTVGLASRFGIIPISATQDTAGPMGRTVADVACLLGALTGVDPRDDRTTESRGKVQADYTQFLDPDGLKGARIGVVRGYFGFNERMDKLIDGLIDVMKTLGATVVDPVAIPSQGQFHGAEYTVLSYEFKDGLNRYLQWVQGAGVHSMKEIIEFNEANRGREMPYFTQSIMLEAEARGPLTEKKYLEARERSLRLSRAGGIDKLMDERKLDALFAPSGGPACVNDLVVGDHFEGGSSDFPAMAGYPNINVPGGHLFGLPFGVSFFGRAWSEPVLLRIAYAFEQATKIRRAPRFLATADLSV